MTFSGSSRKRTREVSWEDVVHSHHLRELTVDKGQLVKDLEEATSVSYFLDGTKKAQGALCELCGITGWEDRIVSAIHDVVR